MSPPLYVKVPSFLLSTILTVAGVRNALFPGAPVALIPADDEFQAHFHQAADLKMSFIFQVRNGTIVVANEPITT